MSLMDLFKKKPQSSENAKKRLQLALVSDRNGCSPEIMEKIKNEIIAVISKYVEIDREGLEINLTQAQSDANDAPVPALYANIPIKELKRTER